MSAAAPTPCHTCATAPAYEGKRCCLLCYETSLVECIEADERLMAVIAKVMWLRHTDAERQNDRRRYDEVAKSIESLEAQLKVVQSGVWPAEPKKKKVRLLR
jgi:hypothetical protein